jgi:LytS/YehU family sensor histidine kinase
LLLAGLAPAVTFLSALAPAGAWMLLRHKPFIANVVLGNADFYIPAYAAWLCLYFYARQARRESAQRRRFAQALEAAAGARNSALRWQVRPHFLFNALNALYTLVIDDRWAQALEMTEALGAYVERSFAEDGRHFVPVAEQAAALNAYLSIEAIRFGERLRLRADIPEALGRAEAPALILHPLVENAMKYAVAASAEPVDIAIWARREGSDLVLAVEDSGGDDDAPQVPGLGVGLSNVEARLAGHYGERASLRCRRLTPKGFVAEIRLPLGAAWTPSAA